MRVRDRGNGERAGRAVAGGAGGGGGGPQVTQFAGARVSAQSKMSFDSTCDHGSVLIWRTLIAYDAPHGGAQR